MVSLNDNPEEIARRTASAAGGQASFDPEALARRIAAATGADPDMFARMTGQDETDEQELERLGPEQQFAVVEMSGQSLAIDILCARTILDRPPITPVPFTPPHILGVANVRGDIYSIVDIRSLLGLSPANTKKPDPLVLLVTGSKYVCGVTIESITEIVRVREKEIAEPTTELPYVAGVYRQGQESVMVLDVEGLLGCPEMTQFQ